MNEQALAHEPIEALAREFYGIAGLDPTVVRDVPWEQASPELREHYQERASMFVEGLRAAIRAVSSEAPAQPWAGPVAALREGRVRPGLPARPDPDSSEAPA